MVSDPKHYRCQNRFTKIVIVLIIDCRRLLTVREGGRDTGNEELGGTVKGQRAVG